MLFKKGELAMQWWIRVPHVHSIRDAARAPKARNKKRLPCFVTKGQLLLLLFLFKKSRITKTNAQFLCCFQMAREFTESDGGCVSKRH